MKVDSVFIEETERYTEVGLKAIARCETLIGEIFSELEKEGYPLRLIEYLLYQAVQMLAAEKLLGKMYRIAKEKRRVNDSKVQSTTVE